ncbi:MAG: transcription antitermination factor NusB [Flammeovirgaceae bacterium]|nr:MAG: transcription antitermination factor NusB [Flammeovirgaceae bacterium]
MRVFYFNRINLYLWPFFETMLNRRSLRIKVMQNLFALQQSKDANLQLCYDRIEEAFTPDLNSMEVQDKKLLNQQKMQALKVFKKAFEKKEDLPADLDDKIKKAVADSLDFYIKNERKDFTYFKKNLVTEVECIYDQYLAVLNLAVALADAAADDKKINHKNFLNNAWITAFRESEDLKARNSKAASQWASRANLVKLWLRDVVKQDADYMDYLDKKNPSVDEQKKLINHLFRKVILGKTVINEFFESEILRWAEDRDIVKGMVEKTVKSFDPQSQKPLHLHELSLNWDDDREFIEKLFTDSANLPEALKQQIAKNTRNWEVDRLPLTDRIILEMALAELTGFPSIPVKVTINEYIELAKNYSTPKSRQFVNGILDVISKELKSAGTLKKSGRGLIDNK